MPVTSAAPERAERPAKDLRARRRAGLNGISPAFREPIPTQHKSMKQTAIKIAIVAAGVIAADFIRPYVAKMLPAA